MDAQDLTVAFTELSTPLVADACVRVGLPVRVAPAGIGPLERGVKLAGRVLPVKHYGSVDIFLEAFHTARPGDVLVVDNSGRLFEGCIGDLTAREAKINQVTGLAVWGCHRDTAELLEIGLPVFSYGSCPAGPIRVDVRERDALESARFGNLAVSPEDVLFGDDDGVLFVQASGVEEVLSVARTIRSTERRQAELIESGVSLHEQLRFREYLDKRREDPSYTFRKHLRSVGGAFEE
jgi:regulator of RNase E activity RraA